MSFIGRHRVSVVVLLLGVLVALLVVWRLNDPQARAVSRRSTELLVGVVKPLKKDFEVKFTYTADILPYHQASIFPKTSGYITRITADRGDFVTAGQLLIEIDRSELEATVEQAQAALASSQAAHKVAQSSLESVRANLANHQANLVRAQAVVANDLRQYERMRALHERGIVSQMELDNSRTVSESSRASVSAAEAQVEVARTQILTAESQVRLAAAEINRQEAVLKLARSNLSNTRILAPFSGYVAQRQLDVGAAVSAQAAATSNSSVPIMVLQNIESVKVLIEASEREAGRIKIGDPVRLTVDAHPGQLFTGSVSRIVQALDLRTRTNGVEVVILNRDRRLKPGMYARVEIIAETRKQALLIPLEALKLEEERPSVLIVRDRQVATLVIERGAQDGTLVEVTGGLTGDESIIVQGKELVKDGQMVRAVPARQY